VAAPSVRPEPVLMPVGVATHFIDKINVVIVKLGSDVRVGDHLMLSGEKGSFKQKLKSMQINRQNVETAARGTRSALKSAKKPSWGKWFMWSDKK